MANYRAILPTATNLTPSNLADNFNERSIRNDDLNMAGYRTILRILAMIKMLQPNTM